MKFHLNCFSRLSKGNQVNIPGPAEGFFCFTKSKNQAATLNEHGESIVGRGPWKSCLFLLTSLFKSIFEAIQSGFSTTVESDYLERRLCAWESRSLLGLSGAPRTALENPWECFFIHMKKEAFPRFNRQRLGRTNNRIRSPR